MKELVQLAIATTTNQVAVREQAMNDFASAITEPMREAVFDGDILFDIYNKVDTPGESTPKFPLHFVTPGTESEYAAYTVPSCGGIPYRSIEGDEVMIHSYKVANSLDTCLDYIRLGRYDVIESMFKAYRAGFVSKMNLDGWRAILHAAHARNLIVADPSATQGQLTKRLISLMVATMERNGGGNSASLNGGKLTDLYMSTEGQGAIRNWNVDQLDEITRREIHENNGMLARLFGVYLHALREFGVGQPFQTYATGTVGVTMPTNGSPSHADVELVVGLDQSSDNSFLMPVSQELETFIDPMLHRLQRWGIYGWLGVGFGVMDTRKTLFGSF